jgi:hypothetical protein
MLNARESELQARVDELRAQLAPAEQELDEIRVAKEAIAARVTQLPAKGTEASAASVDYWNQKAPNSPFRNHTMKQLVRKALSECFDDGATARQLLDLFHHEWGRVDIIRSSLSPQLSRLSREGIIWRDGLVWRLVGPDRQISLEDYQEEEASNDDRVDHSGAEDLL